MCEQIICVLKCKHWRRSFLATLGSGVYKLHISHFSLGLGYEDRLMAVELLCESVTDWLEIRSSN